jgi:hypothetical protein
MTSSIQDAIPCRVTHPAHVQIGGGDPYPVPERSYTARYRNGAVLTSREIEDGSTAWECCFSVEGRPPLGDRPIRRFMTNHGTYAARVGGGPVVIERIDA